MGKRGPKPKSAEERKKLGTWKPSKNVVQLFPEGSLKGFSLDDFPAPHGLSVGAKKLWEYHVRHYINRGQVLTGCEQSLTIYCSMEAKILEAFATGGVPAAVWLNIYIRMAIEFYDTPASQRVKAPPPSHPQNAFARNGRPAAKQ